MRKEPIAQDSRGFTLVEILVAILVLAVVSLGIMTLLPTGLRQVTSAGRVSTLNHLGQMKLDQLRATSFSDLDLQDGLHPSTGAGETFPDLFVSLNTTFEEDAYSTSWVVSDGPKTGMKKVVITVEYGKYDVFGNPIDGLEQRTAYFSTYLTQ